MKVAFFKGTKKGLSAIFDIGVHEWMAGSYAHVELVLSDGRACSSTFLEGGVRIAPAGSIDFNEADWDFLDATGFDEAAALAWFEAHDGAKYDVWGDAHFVIGFVRQSEKSFFCNESVGAALGFEQPWRFDPNSFYYALKRVIAAMQKQAA
jgi:hypothetical protein